MKPEQHTPAGRARRSLRGMTLLEMVVSSGIAAAVIGTAIGVFVKGTQGFSAQQSQSYVQFRTRTAVDGMAKDARGAKIFLGEKTVAGRHYLASDGSDPSKPPTLILQVPAQDANGLFYYGTTDPSGVPYPAPNMLVMDTVVYTYSPSDGTLRRTVAPAKNIRTNGPGGPIRSSIRAAETDAVVATNIGQIRFLFKNRDGNPISAGNESHVSSVDFLTEVKQARQLENEKTQSSVSVTGVRLRNMRSGSIPGTVLYNGQPVAGARVRAVYTSTEGAYAENTIVGEDTTDTSGTFEIYGLDPGSYRVETSAVGRIDTVVSDVVVPEEDAATAITVNMS